MNTLAPFGRRRGALSAPQWISRPSSSVRMLWKLSLVASRRAQGAVPPAPMSRRRVLKYGQSVS